MADQPHTETSAPIRAEIAGNMLEVIESGEARLKALIALIDGARASLKLLMYMFDDDKCGERVRDAMVQAALRGVKVDVLVDGFGSRIKSDFFKPIDDAGGKHCLFHPTFGRRYLLRNHQKLVVADNRVAIIGGANIDEAYLTDSGSKRWRDLWLRIEGPEVAVAGRYFDALFRWTSGKRTKLRSLRRTLSEFSEWRGPLQWKFSGPLSVRNSWWRSIGRDILKASQTDMIFAYFAPPGAMVRRLGRAGGRGQVRIITAAKSDNNSTIAAARHSYSRLLRRHVRMYEFQPCRLHTKLAVVDDIVHIGSSNFDYRSLYINLEVMLRIRDAGFAEAMRGYFERELKQSKWISPEVHKHRASLWRRLKWAFSHFLVNIMDYTVTRRLNFRADV